MGEWEWGDGVFAVVLLSMLEIAVQVGMAVGEGGSFGLGIVGHWV